jgi:hypothetical protein
VPSPFSPATIPSSGGGSISQLFHSVLGADAASVDTGANGVGQSANHLLIVMLLRSTLAANTDTIRFRFNADATGTAYFTQDFFANQTTPNAAASQASGFVVTIPAASSTANLFASVTITVPRYTSALIKPCTIETGYVQGAIGGTTLFSNQLAAWWNNTAAITQAAAVMPANNLLAGSSLTVYGLT